MIGTGNLAFVPRARAVLLAPLACLALLAGCAETVSGTPVSGSAGSSFPTTIPQLASRLLTGNSSITTAHIEFSFGAGGETLKGSGDQKLDKGKATAFALTENVPGVGDLDIRTIDDVLYVKGFPGQGTTTKPWVKITADTTNPSLHAIYESQQQSDSLGSLESVSIFLKSAESLRFRGTDTIDGDKVGRYSLVVNTTKLPDDFPNKSQIVSSGITSIPVRLAVDEQGRSRQVVTTIRLGGTSVTSEFELSKFNEPVTIAAPPASQTTDS